MIYTNDVLLIQVPGEFPTLSAMSPAQLLAHFGKYFEACDMCVISSDVALPLHSLRYFSLQQLTLRNPRRHSFTFTKTTPATLCR